MFLMSHLTARKIEHCRFKIRQRRIDSYFSFLQEVSVLKCFMGEILLLLGFCVLFFFVVVGGVFCFVFF